MLPDVSQMGEGTADGVTQGPLINEAALAKVEAHAADAIAKGAVVRVGGKRRKGKGYFFEPTVLDGCDATMDVASQVTEKTAGPRKMVSCRLDKTVNHMLP